METAGEAVIAGKKIAIERSKPPAATPIQEGRTRGFEREAGFVTLSYGGENAGTLEGIFGTE